MACELGPVPVWQQTAQLYSKSPVKSGVQRCYALLPAICARLWCLQFSVGSGGAPTVSAALQASFGLDAHKHMTSECVCGAGAVVVAVSSATGRGGKNGWLPDDLNNGRLDLFFVFLAGLHPQALTHPMYCLTAVACLYANPPRQATLLSLGGNCQTYSVALAT